MTFLEAINAVLRRLREDAVVSSNSTDYSKLIGDFVNQAKDEVEHAWDWNELKTVTTVTTVAGSDTASFDGVGVKVISVINDTKNWPMRVIPAAYQHRFDYLSSPVNGSPYYYSFQGVTSDYIDVKFYPIPTGAESIRFLIVRHTSEYAVDGTEDARVIDVPKLPVILNAYARAISERGEDGGIGINEADTSYRTALADSISLDASLNHPSEVSWCVI